MTGASRTPRPAAKDPGPLRRAEAFIVFYIVLAAIPVLMWCAAGNPITATLPYLNLDQAELFWNTLRDDPAAGASELALAAIDVGWIIWTPFALAAVLQLIVTVFRIPRTVIPSILLRLTPTTVVSIVVTGTATAAQASAGAVHATALQHHHLRHEHGRGEYSGRGRSLLEAQVRKAIAHSEHQRYHRGAGAHTVQQGETLWVIAEDAYGQGQDWPEIYEANRGRIEQSGEALANPDLIKPGWTLTVPHHGSTPKLPRRIGTDPAPPNAIGTGAPATGGATAATAPRVAPETHAPATTAPRAASSAGERPVASAAVTTQNGANNPPHAAPSPGTDAPWTTGVELPDGGYIGVSLLMAAVGATVALRHRARRTGDRPEVPECVSHLGVIATRAEMAATGEWDPELETDPTPPPLLRPRPEHLIFGTVPDGTDDAILDPQRHPLTVYNGPGAHEAAAALALSALASKPPHRLIVTEALSHHLLGPDLDSHDPDWLALLPDTATALSTAADDLEHADDLRTLVIAEAKSANTFQISAALAADKQRNRLAVLLLGDPSHLAAHTPTSVEIDSDGWPKRTTGPRAAAFASTRFHTVPQATATELYRILRHDRTNQSAARVPTQTRDEHRVTSADQQPEATEADAADDDDHQGPAGAEPDAAKPSPTGIVTPFVSTPHMSDAASAPADEPQAPAALLLLRVLGPLTLENAAGETKPGPGGRNAQLLTYLAIHPRGRTLQQITAAIWHTDKPGGANRTLVRVRQELHAALTEFVPEPSPAADNDVQPIVRESHGTYHLNHRLIRTDYADFTRFEAEARREKDPARRAELAAGALALVCGDLADGVNDTDQHWLATERADLDNRAATLALMTTPPDFADQHVGPATRDCPLPVRTNLP